MFANRRGNGHRDHRRQGNIQRHHCAVAGHLSAGLRHARRRRLSADRRRSHPIRSRAADLHVLAASVRHGQLADCRRRFESRRLSRCAFEFDLKKKKTKKETIKQSTSSITCQLCVVIYLLILSCSYCDSCSVTTVNDVKVRLLDCGRCQLTVQTRILHFRCRCC